MSSGWNKQPPVPSLPAEIVEGHRVAFELTKAFIKGKLPGCDAYYITTFFRPPIRKPDTSLFPPILRPAILAARPAAGAHLLVYQSDSTRGKDEFRTVRVTVDRGRTEVRTLSGYYP